MAIVKPKIAICYDFDGTLAPRNMQEYDYFPQLRIKPAAFWSEAKKRARDQDADEILSYMSLMLDKAKATNSVRITKKDFKKYGSTVPLFPGVEGWFNRISKYGLKAGARVEHYIISSGIREMIEGSKIAKAFKRIYASSFLYDQHGVAYAPGVAINYTTKTQYLFRINKGVLDPWDNSRINDFVSQHERPIPFSRMIYVGDGESDIPCMKLVRMQGGYSIAVFKAYSKKKGYAKSLQKESRVNFVSAANYREGEGLDSQIKRVINRMVASYNVQKYE